MYLCEVVMSGKATHERQLWGDSLLNLFSNCEWAWQTHQACFFTMPGVHVTVVLPGLLSVFGKSGGYSLLEFQADCVPPCWASGLPHWNLSASKEEAGESPSSEMVTYLRVNTSAYVGHDW